MDSTLKVYRIRPWAKLPHRAHTTDAGVDLFYCPLDQTRKDDIVIYQGTHVSVPTGIKVAFDSGNVFMICNKSSMSAKHGLLVGGGIVDHGYDGEVLINLHNVSGKTVFLSPGQKIAQGLLIPIILCNVEESLTNDINSSSISNRGSNGFGSTGTGI